MNPAPSYIARYAERVKDGYSVLREDIVIGGQLETSIVRGSPAPTETVRRYEERIDLDRLARSA